MPRTSTNLMRYYLGNERFPVIEVPTIWPHWYVVICPSKMRTYESPEFMEAQLRLTACFVTDLALPDTTECAWLFLVWVSLAPPREKRTPRYPR